MQHLFTPGSEAILLHALQQLQQLLFLLCPFAHHVRMAAENTGKIVVNSKQKQKYNIIPFLFVQSYIVYLREGLLRLFFKPMLLLLLPRRLDWFFTASSHMPMLPEEPPLPPLPSIPPAPPHIPTPSTHCPPREELPIDMPES